MFDVSSFLSCYELRCSFLSYFFWGKFAYFSYLYHGGMSSLFQLNFPWRRVFTKPGTLSVRMRSNFGSMRSVIGDMSAFGGLLSGFPGGMAYRFLVKAFDGHLLPFLCICPNSFITRIGLGALVAFWTPMLCL